MQRTIILTLIVIGAALAICITIIRPFLKSRPKLQVVFQRIGDHEAGITRLFWGYFAGFRTLIFARALALAGLLLPVLELAGEIDIASLVKPEHAIYVPLVLFAIGLVTEHLRKITTGPVAVCPPDPVEIPEAPLVLMPAMPAPPPIPQPPGV